MRLGFYGLAKYRSKHCSATSDVKIIAIPTQIFYCAIVKQFYLNLRLIYKAYVNILNWNHLCFSSSLFYLRNKIVIVVDTVTYL